MTSPDAAAELKSFSAAARKLGSSRDQISKHISALETELQTPLFVRLDLDDGFVDPARSGADITLCIAHLPEHLNLVARPLATAPRHGGSNAVMSVSLFHPKGRCALTTATCCSTAPLPASA